jgi:hypothetical protein
MINVADMQDEYDWREAMAVAIGPSRIEGYRGPVEFGGWKDIAEVIAYSEGENDGRAWIALFQLHDEIGDSKEAMIRWAMGNEDRQRLGFVDGGAHGHDR